jgi:hypothetical protein
MGRTRGVFLSEGEHHRPRTRAGRVWGRGVEWSGVEWRVGVGRGGEGW